MNITQPIKNLYLVEFKKHSDLCYTFLRFQEYYESPEFKNKVFTLKEYKKWYNEDRDQDRFTYCEDWAGFNIPDYVLEPFIGNLFNPLSKLEKSFLDAFKDLPKPFYIIGVSEKAMKVETKLHELAHGLWYLNKNYRKRVIDIINKIPKSEIKKIHKELKRMGYHKDVFDDETHAMVLSSYYTFIPHWNIKIPKKVYLDLLITHKRYNKTCKLIELEKE
jgi:hypothetical protein